MKDVDEENDKANDSDASTASTASSVSPNPARVGIKEDAAQVVDGSGMPESGLASSVPQLETQKELSKEEKTAQRRQELKRTIGVVDGGTGDPVGNTGLRKKRKF